MATYFFETITDAQAAVYTSADTLVFGQQGETASRTTVAFNPATAEEDYANLPVGGACFYPDDLKFEAPRDDVFNYPLPVKDLMKRAEVDPKLRDHVANMVYVGGLAAILGIDPEDLRDGLNFHFNGKAKAVEMNMNVVNMAMEWVRENLPKQDPYRVTPMEHNKGLLMIDGNSAGALGAIFGGVCGG